MHTQTHTQYTPFTYTAWHAFSPQHTHKHTPLLRESLCLSNRCHGILQETSLPLRQFACRCVSVCVCVPHLQRASTITGLTWLLLWECVCVCVLSFYIELETQVVGVICYMGIAFRSRWTNAGTHTLLCPVSIIHTRTSLPGLDHTDTHTHIYISLPCLDHTDTHKSKWTCTDWQTDAHTQLSALSRSYTHTQADMHRLTDRCAHTHRVYSKQPKMRINLIPHTAEAHTDGFRIASLARSLSPPPSLPAAVQEHCTCWSITAPALGPDHVTMGSILTGTLYMLVHYSSSSKAWSCDYEQ